MSDKYKEEAEKYYTDLDYLREKLEEERTARLKAEAENKRLNERLLEIHRAAGEAMPMGVSASPIDKIRALRAENEKLRERPTLRQVEMAVEDNCSCGGRGPDDPGVCEACLVWHHLQRFHFVAPAPTKGEPTP